MNIYLKNFRQLFFTVIIVMDYFNCQPANAQFVEVMLEIPSKSSVRVFNTGINKGRGWHSGNKNCTTEKLLQNRIDKSTLSWIEITTSENMQMGVEIISNGSSHVPEATYFNNGIPDVVDAVPFMAPRAVFQMDNGGILNENKKGGSRCFKAWILLPADKIRQIIFEYN